MNIDKEYFSKNVMNLDDDVLYNFIDANSQLMRYDGVTSWKGSREKDPVFLQVLFDAFQTQGHCCRLITLTCINTFIFSLMLCSSYTRNINYYVSLIVLFIIVFYYVFHRTLHTCLPYFEASPLGIRRRERCFWFHLEAFDYAIPFTYQQRHQLWRLGWFSNY